MDKDNEAQLQEYRRGINRHLAVVMEYCDMVLQQQPASVVELQLLAEVCHHTHLRPTPWRRSSPTSWASTT